MNKNLLAGLFLLIFLAPGVKGKVWRGITPLKSTRADVERLLGKANELGRFEIKNERVSIWYAEGPCEDNNEAFAKANCECMIAKDTVLRIVITLNSPVKVSTLGIDKKKYERTSIHAYRPTATYSDFTEGVVYTIRELDDVVTNIDYLPSAKDCEEVVRSQTTLAASNVWQGIAPLRSTRADVEQLLGRPRSSLGDIYKYIMPENMVAVTYSTDPCNLGGAKPLGSAADVVLKIAISPRRNLLVKSLGLNKDRYIRIKNDHPENWVHYLNAAEGITVDAILNNAVEEVLSIVYQPTSRDRMFRCGRTPDKKQ